MIVGLMRLGELVVVMRFPALAFASGKAEFQAVADEVLFRGFRPARAAASAFLHRHETHPSNHDNRAGSRSSVKATSASAALRDSKRAYRAWRTEVVTTP